MKLYVQRSLKDWIAVKTQTEETIYEAGRTTSLFPGWLPHSFLLQEQPDHQGNSDAEHSCYRRIHKPEVRRLEYSVRGFRRCSCCRDILPEHARSCHGQR